MGSLFSKFFGKKELRVLMLGLDGAGKTTILYKMKLKQDIATVPTVGFNVERIEYKKLRFNVWDVGGQNRIRPLWRHYYAGTQALIFVVDTNDKDRIDEVRQELHRIIHDRDIKECILLIFANKQDLEHALTPSELKQKLDLDKLVGFKWFVQPSCALTGDGLLEGIDWLRQQSQTKI
jgi:ADP-ribosylation factor protein 6